MPIIEDFWPRVLGSITWLLFVIAWPALVIFVVGWVVCWLVSWGMLLIG